MICENVSRFFQKGQITRVVGYAFGNKFFRKTTPSSKNLNL